MLDGKDHSEKWLKNFLLSPFMDILQNPESIVGQQVNHRFVIDGETKWFGTIICYDATTKMYELAYNQHCYFDLWIDIANGDVEICWDFLKHTVNNN